MQKARNGRIAGKSHWLEAACVRLLQKRTSAVLGLHLRPLAVGNLPFLVSRHPMTVGPFHESLLYRGKVNFVGYKQLDICPATSNIITFYVGGGGLWALGVSHGQQLVQLGGLSQDPSLYQPSQERTRDLDFFLPFF